MAQPSPEHRYSEGHEQHGYGVSQVTVTKKQSGNHSGLVVGPQILGQKGQDDAPVEKFFIEITEEVSEDVESVGLPGPTEMLS